MRQAGSARWVRKPGASQVLERRFSPHLCPSASFSRRAVPFSRRAGEGGPKCRMRVCDSWREAALGARALTPALSRWAGEGAQAEQAQAWPVNH
ncbi:hypothetical protein AZ78_1676 [Lysobacter capsici AZ78]|uniref:Uncharacterized protein n=1 Tax=Lysobacter capsici AZ78 TaxID=1444315 RepID=A0A108U7T6_9GAMM|nr:hypothetical protein AZ78_1676 [Lysobacter capsici AZ78]